MSHRKKEEIQVLPLVRDGDHKFLDFFGNLRSNVSSLHWKKMWLLLPSGKEEKNIQRPVRFQYLTTYHWSD